MPPNLDSLQCSRELKQDADECADREDVCAGTIEVVVGEIAEVEEYVFEDEVEEEPINQCRRARCFGNAPGGKNQRGGNAKCYATKGS